jgi:hypothetical protein
MEIKGEDYSIVGDTINASVTFHGALRLRGMREYAPIMHLMDDVAAAAVDAITLNLQDLRFLNSSGINMLFRFVIQVRDQATCQVVVRGSAQVPWQTKSLENLQRLMPSLQLEFE